MKTVNRKKTVMAHEPPSEHFILKGRLVGTDDGWADCVCGWHYEGTVKGSIEEGERHLKENEAGAVA